MTLNYNGLKALYEVSLKIAKAKKPQTTAEELILPSAIILIWQRQCRENSFVPNVPPVENYINNIV